MLVVVVMVVILLLLFSLAAVAGHNDCQRAGGLELMLELSDWNAQTGHGACKRAGAARDHTPSPSFNLYDRSNHKQAGRYSMWSQHASIPVLTRQQQVESCKIFDRTDYPCCRQTDACVMHVSMMIHHSLSMYGHSTLKYYITSSINSLTAIGSTLVFLSIVLLECE